MGQIVSVISGKGGVGKTTLAAGIASCLAAEGRRVLCLDLDVGLRNLDISLGMSELAALSFLDVMSGSYSLQDAAEHPQIPGLFLLTAPVGIRPEQIDSFAFSSMLRKAAAAFDWCIIDAPAGIGPGFQLATACADRIAVVAGADPASLRDAACAAALLPQEQADTRLIINRIDVQQYRRLHTNIDDIMDSVGLPLLGIVPEDFSVTIAAAGGQPLILQTKHGAAVACLHIARRLEGRKMPLMKLR